MGEEGAVWARDGGGYEGVLAAGAAVVSLIRYLSR